VKDDSYFLYISRKHVLGDYIYFKSSKEKGKKLLVCVLSSFHDLFGLIQFIS
jgi:hypothetical protein